MENAMMKSSTTNWDERADQMTKGWRSFAGFRRQSGHLYASTVTVDDGVILREPAGTCAVQLPLMDGSPVDTSALSAWLRSYMSEMRTTACALCGSPRSQADALIWILLCETGLPAATVTRALAAYIVEDTPVRAGETVGQRLAYGAAMALMVGAVNAHPHRILNAGGENA
jgi:hypothetical protein